MLTLKRRKKSAKRFTMVELLAVITITTILLGITIRIMKTDSTKTNASVLAGVLNYAKTYSMTSLESDGTQTLKVTVENRKVTLTLVDTSPAATTIVKEEGFASGSSITDIGGTAIDDSSSVDFDYNYKGEPGTSSETVFKITDSRNSSNELEVKLKPFTGKVTFY